jgi:HEAT repeat protein
MKKNLGIALAVLLGLLFFSTGLLIQQQIDQPQRPGLINSDCYRIVICSEALGALGKIGDPRAKEVAINGLINKNSFIRSAAIQVLDRLGDRKTIPLLKEALKDKNYIIRILTTKALLDFGEPGMEIRLLHFLDSPDAATRAMAVEQLGSFKYRYLERIAQTLAKDKNTLVRLRAIEQLGINLFNPAIPLIEQALQDPDPRIRQAACIAISQLKDYMRFNLLGKLLNDSAPIVRSAAKIGMTEQVKVNPAAGGAGTGKNELLISLEKDLESQESVLRVSSFIGLANLKDVTILPLLLKEITLAQNSSFIKKGAARALRILKPYVVESFDKLGKSTVISSANLELSYKVNGRNLLDLVIEALKNKTSPLHADSVFILGELLEDASLPALREALFQKDPDVAASAAYVLGLFRDKGAVPYLIKVCQVYGL